MGADNSKITSTMDSMYSDLPPEQVARMKKAENERGRRLSVKAKTKTEFLADVTAYPDKQYTTKELVSIEKSLGKRLQHLHNQISQLSQQNMAGFSRIYQDITDGNGQTAIASTMEQHRVLNRYNNIVAYDASRVKVTPSEHTHNSDYVNANYIHGHGRANMYIASQGPVPESMAGFWHMIWENNSRVIVMVTNEVEGGKLKCHRYWPDVNGKSVSFGNIEVTMTEVESHPTYIARCFLVKNTQLNEERYVFQYQYVAWPDHGVPKTAVEMLKFRAIVKEKFNSSHGPVVVHCSAGVGRTGTFIGLDRYLDSCADLDDSKTILDLVKDMRKSRNYMVQAQAQFIYLYHAAAEGLQKLLEKVQRELQFVDLSPEKKEQAMLEELEKDIQLESETFKEQLLIDGVGRKASLVPDARHDDGTKYTSDINNATATSPEKRIQSLASSTTEWTRRGNVPMSPEQHGYDVDTVDLETRLGALSDSRTNWMKIYSEAEKTWQSAQDEEGVFYDVGHQLTSIESRVMSLANADAAWALNNNGISTVYEEMARENLANLELRLQSLSYTLMTSDQRWRDRGNGFRGPTSSEDHKSALQSSNETYQGTLTDRLMSLKAEHSAWQKRDNTKKFDRDKFFKEVESEYERQEQVSKQKEKERKALNKKLEEEAAKTGPSPAERKRMAMKMESARWNDAKTTAEKASVANLGDYLPHKEHMAKADAKRKVEEQKAAKEVAELEAYERKRAQKEKKEKEKADAKKKASKFMKKMTK